MDTQLLRIEKVRRRRNWVGEPCKTSESFKPDVNLSYAHTDSPLEPKSNRNMNGRPKK